MSTMSPKDAVRVLAAAHVSLSCEDFHHGRADYHDDEAPCPVVKRVAAAWDTLQLLVQEDTRLCVDEGCPQFGRKHVCVAHPTPQPGHAGGAGVSEQERVVLLAACDTISRALYYCETRSLGGAAEAALRTIRTALASGAGRETGVTAEGRRDG